MTKIGEQAKGFLSNDTLAGVNPALDSLPASADDRELVRILVIGSHWGVNLIIRTLYLLGFAQVSEWSSLQPAPNSVQVMSILTRRIARDRTT